MMLFCNSRRRRLHPDPGVHCAPQLTTPRTCVLVRTNVDLYVPHRLSLFRTAPHTLSVNVWLKTVPC